MKVFKSKIDGELYVSSINMVVYGKEFMKYNEYPKGKWKTLPQYKENSLVEVFEDFSKNHI